MNTMIVYKNNSEFASIFLAANNASFGAASVRLLLKTNCLINIGLAPCIRLRRKEPTLPYSEQSN